MKCTHCEKDTPGVSQETFDGRVKELTEKRKLAETRASELEGLAKQAAPLAAKAYGYEDDSDTLDTLQSRFTKAKGSESPFAGNFAEWLADPAGAGADKVAARFRVAAPVATPVAPADGEPPTAVAPVAPPRPAATSSTTVAPTPVVPPRYTLEQVRTMNAPLMKERAALVMAKKPTTEIDAKMAINRKLLDATPTA